MKRLIILTPEEAAVIERGLYSAKFALEQDVDGQEKQDAVRKINEALDQLRNSR